MSEECPLPYIPDEYAEGCEYRIKALRYERRHSWWPWSLKRVVASVDVEDWATAYDVANRSLQYGCAQVLIEKNGEEVALYEATA